MFGGRVMEDPVLGPLQPCPHLEGDLLATVPFDGRQIKLRICLGGDELQSCLELARELVASLQVLQTKARAVAADDLLENYNENWRMFTRYRADGSVEDVTHPPLSAEEFGRRLRLEGLAVTGSSMIEFCFSDDGLFAGHSVFVASGDGTAFADGHASLFG
jgi:hypothetical protein